jgi:hypothetical protein
MRKPDDVTCQIWMSANFGVQTSKDGSLTVRSQIRWIGSPNPMATAAIANLEACRSHTTCATIYVMLTLATGLRIQFYTTNWKRKKNVVFSDVVNGSLEHIEWIRGMYINKIWLVELPKFNIYTCKCALMLPRRLLGNHHWLLRLAMSVTSFGYRENPELTG